MNKIKQICYVSFLIFFTSSIFLQFNDINNDQIGKTTEHISINSTQIVKNWDELGLIKMRFSQFLPEIDGIEGISEEFIFNCINDPDNYCLQSDSGYSKIPYVSYPATGYLPLFFLKKIFPNTEIKFLSKILLKFYYLITALLLSKIIYDYMKKKLFYDKNLKYIFSLGVFLKFYIDSFLYVQYSSIYIAETIETLFILLVIYFRFKIHYNINKKNLFYYSLSLILLSFHNFIVFIYILFEFLIVLIVFREKILIFFKTLFITGFISGLINFGVIYYNQFSFGTLLKISNRFDNIKVIDVSQNKFFLDIFLNNMVLTPAIKYLILLSFIICVLNFFLKNIFKSQSSIVLMPLFLTFFTFLIIFKNYHLQHDYFVIKFHILGMLSFIPLIYLYSFIINRFNIFKYLLEIKNYIILFIFYIYYYFEIQDILLL